MLRRRRPQEHGSQEFHEFLNALGPPPQLPQIQDAPTPPLRPTAPPEASQRQPTPQHPWLRTTSASKTEVQALLPYSSLDTLPDGSLQFPTSPPLILYVII